MRTQSRNDMVHAVVANPALAQKPHQSATDIATAFLDQRQLPWLHSYATEAPLRGLLAGREYQLKKALIQIDGFQRQASTLKRKIARLTKEVAQAHHFSDHDELTGLPNRRLLADRFSQAIARGARQQMHVALLFLDLDRFKIINDTLGHAAGDNLLRQVAVRLVSCVRASDTACRYGGDEFVLLLSELNGSEQAVTAQRKIRACLSKPYLVDGTITEVTIRIGMAVYPVDGVGYVDLLLRSDVAMYCEKARNHAMTNVPPSTLIST